MTRVLVTGAGGFIGRHVADILAGRGDEVHATALRRAPALPGVRWHPCDLLDDGAVDALMRRIQPEALIHLAWYVEPRTCWEAPINRRWTQAGVRLLDAFAAGNGRRAVCVGSVFEYDWTQGWCVEDRTPLGGPTLYGACKAELGSLLAAGAHRLGVELAWGRVFWLYGPHEPDGRLVSSVVRGLLAGERVAVTSGVQRRDYLHVRDVAAALVAVLDSSVSGAINIGSGEPVAVREIFERIAARLEKPELLVIGGRREASPEAPLVAADISRLRQEVGFAPTLDLDRGIADTVSWWRSRDPRPSEMAVA